MGTDKRKLFERAFDEYADAIFRYCYFRLSDRERAKEITQEAFMKAWEYAVRGEDIRNVRALLYRIAHNLVVNAYRDDKGESSLDDLSERTGFDPKSPGATPEEEAEKRFAVRLLERLEPASRQVMVMRYVDDLPVKEIASVIGETETAVSVRIHRAIKKLRLLMQ